MAHLPADVTWDAGYTEAPDETAHGDYMKLMASAGLAFNYVHLQYLADGDLRITRTEREADFPTSENNPMRSSSTACWTPKRFQRISPRKRACICGSAFHMDAMISTPPVFAPTRQLARMGLMIFRPAKCFSFSVTITQSFASAIAAMIMSSGLRGRPFAVPSAISRAQMRLALSSNGSTRPANSAWGPSGPETNSPTPCASFQRASPGFRAGSQRLSLKR